MNKPRIMDLAVQNALMRSSQASEHMHGEVVPAYVKDVNTGRTHCRVCWHTVQPALALMLDT